MIPIVNMTPNMSGLHGNAISKHYTNVQINNGTKFCAQFVKGM